MRILCDLHHGDLFYSLQLLFEKRFSFELYRPVGLDWYYQGYWNVYPHVNTAKQYLDFNSDSSIPKDIHGNLLPKSHWGNEDYRIENGIYYIVDQARENIQRGITFEKMKETSFDIIIASIPAHLDLFQKLKNTYQPHAKLIFQIGNPGWKIPSYIKNVLNSTIRNDLLPNLNSVTYHQELDLDVFNYVEPASQLLVNSFIHYMPKLDLLESYKKLLSSWKFKTYGAGMEFNLCKATDIANQIKESGWTWHIKPLGDGFGHALHNTYACGRPTIINKAYYKNMWGERLLEDQVTCIDIGIRSIEENIKLLEKHSKPEEHLKLCENAKKRFDNVVNFDEEEILIRKFIENLQ